MRLIELRLKNLNSLKGEWHIDFSDKAFIDEGIFAITGQTGAGKTTILDAICLALYGETPRINSISKSSNEVMTRQTSDCYAEVVIDLDGMHYRCRWGQRRAYNKSDGNLQDATHEIAKINLDDPSKGDEIIEEKLSRTKETIVKLTSMDFQQFTRSILLAQGSFSAFLKARPEERADILEKITGTQIYAEISKNTHEKYRLEKEELERLQALSNSLPLLDADTETQYRVATQTFSSTLTAKKATLATVEAQLNWLNEVASLQAQLSQYQDERVAAEQAKLDFQTDAVRLDDANKALEIDRDYQNLIIYRQQHASLQSNKQHTNELIKDAQPQLAQSQIDLDQALVALTKASDDYDNALPLIRKTRELDLDIRQNQQRMQDQQAQKNKLNAHLEEIALHLKNNVAAQQQTENELNRSRDYLATHPHHKHLSRDIESFHHFGKQIKTILQNNEAKANACAATQNNIQQLSTTLAQLEDNQNKSDQVIAEQKSTVAHLKQQLNDLLQGQTLQALRQQQNDSDQSSAHLTAISSQLSLVADMAMQAQTTQAKLPSLQGDIDGLRQSITDKTLTLASLNTEYADKKANLDLLQQVAKLEDFIHLLQEDEPCPLCGAREHPYRQNHPLMQDKQDKTQDNGNEPTPIPTPIAQLNNRLDALNQQIEHLQTVITNDKMTLASLATELNGYNQQLVTQFQQMRDCVVENQVLLTTLEASLVHCSPSIETLFSKYQVVSSLLTTQTELTHHLKDDATQVAQANKVAEANNTLPFILNAIKNSTAHASLQIQTLKHALISQKEAVNTLLDDQDKLTQQIAAAEQQRQALEQQASTAIQDSHSVKTNIQLQHQQLNNDTTTIAENFDQLSALMTAIAQLSAPYQADDSMTWATLNTVLTQINKAIGHKQVFSEDEVTPHLQALRVYCQWLQQQQQHYDKQNSLSQQLSSDLSNLTTKITALQHQRESYHNELSATAQQIAGLTQTLQTLQASRQALYQDKDMDSEEKRLRLALDAAKEALSQAREQHHSLQQRLEHLKTKECELDKDLIQTNADLTRQQMIFDALIKDNGFENEASFKAAILERDAREALNAKQQSIESAFKIATHNVEDIAAQLQLKQAAPLLALDGSVDTDIAAKKAQLAHELTAIADEVAELNRQLGAIEQKLSDNDAHKLAQQAQLAAIKQQKERFEGWRNLRELIGSADGKKYRTFAQGLTFQVMVSHANTQLQKMSDRYLLTRDEQSPLELNVIDKYQGSLQRSTKNLSGGEGFIISLALALGLSNMASQKIRVDSLFLDEGFGTLDEDSLDIALETLTNLQAEGKLIGVISHVQALKERILTQIKVEKISGGHSQITGVGCRRIA